MFALVGCCLGAKAQQRHYSFSCREYANTTDRAANLIYDDVNNTFAVPNTGVNQVAFRMKTIFSDKYVIDNDQTCVVITGRNLSIETDKTKLWWLNGWNGGQHNPTYAFKSGDDCIFVWDLSANSGTFGSNYNFSNETIKLSKNGSGDDHCMMCFGFTAEDESDVTNNPGKFTNIQYLSKAEIAAQYGYANLGYASEADALTELQSLISARVTKATAQKATFSSDENKSVLQAAIDAAGSQTDLADALSDMQGLRAAMNADLTSLIKNPSFESNSTTGWTVDTSTILAWKGVNGSGDGDPVTDGSYLFGVWDGSVQSASISQNIILPKGVYRLYVDMHAPDRNNHGTVRIKEQRVFAGDVVGYFKDQIEDNGSSDTYQMQTLSVAFKVANDNTTVSIGVATGNAPAETWFKIDNFRLFREDNTSVTISDAGLATYASPLALDLSGVENLKAYKASVSENTAALTAIGGNLPAKTGVLLRNTDATTGYQGSASEAVTYTLPFAAANVSAIDGNAFVGTVKDITLSQTNGDYTNFVLSKDGEGNVGFYKAKSSATLAANKAYLPVMNYSSSAVKMMFFDEETGIESIEHSTLTIDHEAGAVFDLSGRRVSKAQKGLYILNGKKVLVK